MKQLVAVNGFLLLIFFNFAIHAQTQFKWTTGGGSVTDFSALPSQENEQTKFMCTDVNGNVYALSQVGIDPVTADTFHGTAVGGDYQNTLLTSYNCNGQMRWAKLISSGSECIPHFIVTDNAGHLYVLGSFTHLGDLLHIGYDTTLVAPTYQPEMLIQFDTSGHYNWLRYIGDNSPATNGAFGYSVLAIDGNNNAHFFAYMRHGVHITPSLTSIGGTYDLVYNPAGSLLSTIRVDLDSQWYFNDAVIDPITNKLYVSGQINQSIYGGFLTDTFFAAHLIVEGICCGNIFADMVMMMALLVLL